MTITLLVGDKLSCSHETVSIYGLLLLPVTRRAGDHAPQASAGADKVGAMFLGIDHVGFMTDDPVRAGVFMKLLGMSLNDQGVGPGYGVACDFWQFSAAPEEVALELVTPTRNDSAIS